MRATLERGMKMRKVKVKREELLVKVKANREKHVAEYEEAVIGYKEEAIRAVDKVMGHLKTRIHDLEAGEVLYLHAVAFDLEVPQNHSKDYDQVIEMLTMSVDEELEIQSDEFACYVMDDWDWKQDFLHTNRKYLSK
jgi:hypothetical protein